jgi:hypothetical protein
MKHQELSEVFRKHKSDTEIFHDLTPNRTREILLLAPIYEAFALEQDGLLADVVFGEYTQLKLPLAPRVTAVTNREEAVRTLKTRRFDQVFIMSSPQRQDAVDTSRVFRDASPGIHISLLLSDNAELKVVTLDDSFRRHFDQVFVWNGHSEIFLAMVKCREDRLNVANDTRMGGVRVILLAENSIRAYSRLLPMLYSEIVQQTHRLIDEEHQDGLKKILRMRARTKLLLAVNTAEAIELAASFRENLLAVITNVRFGEETPDEQPGGVALIHRLREENPHLPVLIQSGCPEAEALATGLGVPFVDTDSESVGRELSSFFRTRLGFGDFVFRSPGGQEIARAANLEEWQNRLKSLPIESLLFHAEHNHFSAWLMARGEIRTARMILKARISDFPTPEDLRTYLIGIGHHLHKENIRGRVVPFDELRFGEEHAIGRLDGGSLGGKGRGIAFLNSLLGNSRLGESIPDIRIRIPQTVIIGINEFTRFIERNTLQGVISGENDFDTVKRRFLTGEFSTEVKGRLARFLQRADYPLAVRSSGLLEDSVSHPLSGLYQTFFLPNNDPDPEIRLRQLIEAIKLVYASIYSPSARAYFEAIDYKVEEERMAVIIQQLVGTSYGNFFYPHLSGVAQSYNFYPYSYIQPDDGAGLVALGLGCYVVGGEKSFRFCPAYPHLELTAPEEQLKTTQNHFYALDLTPRPIDLFNGDSITLATLGLPDAESHGTLTSIASVWNATDQRLEPGLHRSGPRVLNFAYILKYQKIPLAPAIQEILGIARLAMESPVEIEYAVNLNDPACDGGPALYLLQVKHLLREQKECSLEMAGIPETDVFLLTQKGMGNGVVDDVTDVVWADPERFDKSRTREMAREVEQLNLDLKKSRRKYMLLGPGRWGTRDRWLGIPINWPQISHAKIIVEYALADFQVDASLGSHFFHNVTSMNIGYFTVPHGEPPNRIDWQWLRGQPVSWRGEYFVHSTLPQPLKVVMDGRQSLSVAFKSR